MQRVFAAATNRTRQSIQAALWSPHFDVLFASPENIYDVISKAANREDEFSVIIIDCDFTEAFELPAWIRDRWESHFIFVSDIDCLSRRVKAATASTDAFFILPCDEAALTRLVHEYTGE